MTLLFAAGCQDVRHDYCPLEVGNSWTYLVTVGGRPAGRDTIRVVEEAGRSAQGIDGASLDGTRRFRVREPAGLATWVRDETAVLRILGSTVTTILQYPPFVGFGWTDEGPGGERIFCKVVAREIVKTPADWFVDCVVIERESEGLSVVVRQWFAPEVGLVRWRVERPGREPVEWTLSEFRTAHGVMSGK